MTPRADRPKPPGPPPHPLVARMNAALDVGMFDKGYWEWWIHPLQMFAYRGAQMIAEAPKGRRGRSQRRRGREMERKAYAPTGWTRKKRTALAARKKLDAVAVRVVWSREATEEELREMYP